MISYVKQNNLYLLIVDFQGSEKLIIRKGLLFGSKKLMKLIKKENKRKYRSNKRKK